MPQADALNVVLRRSSVAPPLRVVDVQVPEHVLLERLGGRISCPKCGASYHLKFTPPKAADTCDSCGAALITRADDKPEAIRSASPSIARRRRRSSTTIANRALLSRVDGVGELELVLGRIVRALDA